MFEKECLFEISWEVCNKVGGINTVISSKSANIQKYFPNYFLVGPYFKSSENECIIENVPQQFSVIYNELKSIGIVLHFGTWLIKGNPKVILVEYLNYAHNLNEIKGKLWEHFKIDSLNSSWYDFDEAILWSWACGVAIEKLSVNYDSVYVHAHEWMSGGAIFYNKIANNTKARTIFTTHATMLGRALSSNGFNIYHNLENVDFDKKAYEIGVHTKHQTEKALANISDSFTTVSNITDDEALKFYGKACDVILYNGFDNSFISDFESLNKGYDVSRDKLVEFTNGYFGDFYDFDSKNSMLLFTSGRNEFKNKGDDILISSLGKLNEYMKDKNFEGTLVSFFLVPIGEFERDELVINSFENYKKKVQRKINKSYAPLSTHKLPFENPFIKACFENKLFNNKEDKVKVIIVPVYLNGNDGFFNRDYYDVTRGFDLSVFASSYEPWGYTPLESISYAVPTVTSDLAGFGRYINLNYNRKNAVKVLKRENVSFEKSSDELFNYILNFFYQNKEDYIKLKEEAKTLALNFDWKEFIKNYLKAYEIADKRQESRD